MLNVDKAFEGLNESENKVAIKTYALAVFLADRKVYAFTKNKGVLTPETFAQIMQEASEVISQVNEYHLIDIDRCMSLTRGLLNFKFSLLKAKDNFLNILALAKGPEIFLASFLEPGEIEQLDALKDDLVGVANRLVEDNPLEEL